jgi:GT2 family glycosyltransferase
LERHPLGAAGRLRHIRIEPGTGGPGRQRNLGWRSSDAATIVFIDDDCRPTPQWLEALTAVAGENPAAVVQGATRNDPLEMEVHAAPHARSLQVDPPNEFGQACNILYPRMLLDRLGGFREDIFSGEDTDLLRRAVAADAPHVGAPDALVFHCVESYSLPAMLKLSRKWADLPAVVAAHPEMRRLLWGGLFWRRSHAELMLAAAGAALARRHPALLALAVPYVRGRLRRRGATRRGRLASAVELPGQATIDAAEIAILARGSLRHGTVML